MLREARRDDRTARDGCSCTPTRWRSWLARSSAVNRLARRLGRAGLIDHEREAMRKSDHRNAIRSHEHFEALCASAGLEVVERRYYNVVVKAVVEDLFLRLLRAGAPRGSRRTQTATTHGPGRVRGRDRRPRGGPPGRAALASRRRSAGSSSSTSCCSAASGPARSSGC